MTTQKIVLVKCFWATDVLLSVCTHVHIILSVCLHVCEFMCMCVDLNHPASKELVKLQLHKKKKNYKKDICDLCYQ